METSNLYAADIAEHFNAYVESHGPIAIGHTGNALYKARVKFDRLEFRDGFGKWKIIHRDTLNAILPMCWPVNAR